MNTSLGSIFTQSFENLWIGVADFLPLFLLALIIFVVGWIIASLAGRGVAHLLSALKLDHALRSAGLEGPVKRAGFKLNSGIFVGVLVKWFIIVVFLIAALDVLGLTQVNQFLGDVVVTFLPKVIVSVLILLVGAVLGEAMQNVVVGSAKAAHMKSAKFLGAVTRWSIYVFAVLAALFQLGVAAAFIQTLFTGVIVALSLAFGLAFGLGGQTAAADYLAKLKEEITEKE